MAQNMPQRVIHLGDWEFVSFVNHTQMAEQKLFEMSRESNCDIMFLVRRRNKVRLMSFKSNPWLSQKEKPNRQTHPEIYKQAIFIFNGVLLEIPTAYESGQGDESAIHSGFKRQSRRFNNDKIQCAQLITQTQGSYQ